MAQHWGRGGGVTIGVCRHFPRSLLRAVVPTGVGIAVSGCERSVTGARIVFTVAATALIDVC